MLLPVKLAIEVQAQVSSVVSRRDHFLLDVDGYVLMRSKSKVNSNGLEFV